MTNENNKASVKVSYDEFTNSFEKMFGKKKTEQDALNAYNDERLVSKFDKLDLNNPTKEDHK